jgi:hypothetical protein
MRTTFLFLTLLAALAPAASAQHPGGAPGGPGVLAHASIPVPLAHRFRYASGAMAPTGTGADLRVALLHPPALERDSERGWSVTGAVIGGIVGVAVGGALGCLANRDDYGTFCGGQSDTKVAVGAVLGAGAGAFIGARLPGWVR